MPFTNSNALGKLPIVTVELDGLQPATAAHAMMEADMVLNPSPITVNAGSQRGTSDDIKVKTNPTAESGEQDIAFPEQLVFSAFDVGTETGPVPKKGKIPVRIFFSVSTP
jgi:hypothetical protein